MSRKKIFLIILALVIIFLFYIFVFFNNQDTTVKINNHTFQVEIARTAAEHYQGLSDRKNLAENSGMLFIFKDYQPRNFVMRDMNFPLDIVWIKDNLVVACARNVPIFDKNGDFSRVNSELAINLVLELNAGICSKYNIHSGDMVDIQYLK